METKCGMYVWSMVVELREGPYAVSPSPEDRSIRGKTTRRPGLDHPGRSKKVEPPAPGLEHLGAHGDDSLARQRRSAEPEKVGYTGLDHPEQNKGHYQQGMDVPGKDAGPASRRNRQLWEWKTRGQ